MLQKKTVPEMQVIAKRMRREMGAEVFLGCFQELDIAVAALVEVNDQLFFGLPTVGRAKHFARRMRREIIEMIGAAKSGHPGGSLSAVELVVTLYFDVLRHDPSNPKWPDRDRFILSKGHAAPVLYAAMAEAGYTPIDQLNTLRKLGSIYQGHPDVRFIPSLEASTGSLGEGVSLALGMSLAARLNGSPARTYVMLGEGETQEGQVWEGAMFGAAALRMMGHPPLLQSVPR